MRKWAYKTDAAGWAVRKVGTFFLPLMAAPVLWAIFDPDAPPRRSAALPVMFAVAFVWLAVVGAVYLYLALSGGVMSEAGRRRRGYGSDAP